MVVISEAFLERIESKATQEALALNVASLTCQIYFDSSYARFEIENIRNLFSTTPK